MNQPERRKHIRLSLKLGIFCRRIDNGRKLASGQTKDISTGGLCMRTSVENIKQGELMSYSMFVPSEDLIFDIGEQLEGFARVTRVEPLDSSAESVISMQFCNSPKSLCALY